MSNELPLIAVLAKRLVDLQARFRTLSKQEGPRGPQGPQGPQGLPGKDGQDGKDGRDGVDGKDGKDGIDGKDGKDGRDGIDGKDGAKGEKGDPPAHKWDGTKLSFQRPDGTWGKKVDLRGEKGTGGSSRVVVAAGGDSDSAAWNPDLLASASDSPTPTEMLVKQGGVWVRASLGQVQSWLGTAPVGGVTVEGVLVTVNGETVTVNGV